MPTVETRAWTNQSSFLRDPDVIDGVLRDSELFEICSMDSYLEALEARTGKDFSAARRMLDHSMVFRRRDEHLSGRRLTAPFFTPKNIANWRPCVERAVEAGLEALAGAPAPDLVANFTKPVFTAFMARFIGLVPVPADDLYDCVQTANQLVHPHLSLADLIASNAAIGTIMNRISASHAKVVAPPQAFADFLAATPESERSGIDTIAMAAGVLIGSMTLAQFLNLALHGLLRQPKAVWAEVARPGWVQANLDRILSLYPSGLAIIRAATADVEIAGCPYRAGSSIVMDTAAANAHLRRAHAQQPDHALRILSFGAGVHKCPGEAVSRLFLSVALPAIASRFPNLALHVDRARFAVSPMLQVPLSLPCERDGRSLRLSARMVEVKSLEAARAIVNDDTFMPPAMEAHLSALAKHSGMDLEPAIRIARNAMFFMSGERHAALRRAVADQLGGNRLKAWQPRIEAAVDDGLARLAVSTAPNLINDFADPVFHGTTHDLFGIAPADPDRFNQLAPKLQDVLEPWLPMRELRRLQDIFADLLGTMRLPTSDDGHSLLSALLAADLPGFDQDDRKAVVLVLYGASFNLAHTLGNVLYWILSQPPEERGDAGNPGWVDRRLEELISLCASPKYIYRMSRDATTIDGHEVGAKDTLRLQLLSINRGTAVGNLAFGHGLHRCVGAALSKRVLRTAVPRLFQAFPDLALLPQQQRFFPMSQTVALSSLPCRLTLTSKDPK